MTKATAKSRRTGGGLVKNTLNISHSKDGPTAGTATGPTDGPLDTMLLAKIDAWWRAANYLSVGQIYLYDNPLLKKPLKKGTCKATPGWSLGHDTRVEFHLRSPQSRHQESRPGHDLCHRTGSRRAGHRSQYLA